ncbi:hypothetical protein [Burkholderia ubonensis]|uniref:hypothetical protein n=1 Tax=Burkholderia ubonensis TaxID=101571 RepID=UPI00075FD29B|nr:hypothetical protein [Burkholderia ubonensis]KWO65884.1 hypothetical protein WM31_20050 [Burkholderia ubonensis]
MIVDSTKALGYLSRVRAARGADTELKTFLRLYFVRAADTNIRIPKALCAALLAALISDDLTGANTDCPDRHPAELSKSH